MLRTAPLIGFRKTVRDLGGDPERMLKELELSPLILENPELVITHESFLRLLNLAARETGSEYFGFLLSKHVDISVLGSIGLLLQHSDTVEDALQSFIRYYPTRFQDSIPAIKVDGDLAYFYFHIKGTSGDLKQHRYLATGIGLMLMKFLCGDTWKPIGFYSSEKTPANLHEITQFFEAPIRFGQDKNLMIFKASDLKKKIAGNTGQLKRYIQPQIDEMENQLPMDIVSNTEYLIRILLHDGNCQIENITSLLSTNERSLQRKLKASGTSFRQLVEKVRKSIAKQQLLHSDLSNSQLAYLLGYSELSAFTRAFKRWFGVAPSKWNNQ
ncbi:AraC family transcriptional regulator [bacterium]|nr:AraC family transcriptional regulator [bacterium]